MFPIFVHLSCSLFTISPREPEAGCAECDWNVFTLKALSFDLIQKDAIYTDTHTQARGMLFSTVFDCSTAKENWDEDGDHHLKVMCCCAAPSAGKRVDARLLNALMGALLFRVVSKHTERRHLALCLAKDVPIPRGSESRQECGGGGAG